MEDEEVYLRLSRKELQVLSKKNGLPARKTNSYMAKSLALHFQNKHGSISTSEVRNGGIESLSHTSPVSESRSQLNLVGEIHNGIGDNRDETGDPSSYGRSSLGKEKKCGNMSMLEERTREKEALLHASNVSETQSQLNPVGETQEFVGIDCSRDELVDANSCGWSSLSTEVLDSAVNVEHRDPSINDDIAEGFDNVNNDNEETEKKDSLKTARETEDMVGAAANDGQGDLSHIDCENRDIGTLPTNKNIISSNGTKGKVARPRVNFYVRAEEGLNLCVNLKSSLTSWINDLNKNVGINPNDLGKSVCIHELQKTQNGTEQPRNESGTVCIRSSSSSIVRESVGGGVDHPDTRRSLRFSTMPSSSQVEMPSNVEGNGSFLGRPNLEVLNPAKPTTKLSDQNGGILNLSLEVPSNTIVSQQNGEIPDFAFEVPKVSQNEHADSLEHQSKSGSVCLANPETIAVQTLTGAPESGFPQLNGTLERVPPVTDVVGNDSIPCLGTIETSGFMASQVSENVNHCEDNSRRSCRKGLIPDLNVPVDFETDIEEPVNEVLDINSSRGSLYECLQEQQRDLRIVQESSESLHHENPRGSKRFRSSVFEGLPSKRQQHHSEEPDGPNLRSRKNQPSTASPRARRSQRFAPKV